MWKTAGQNGAKHLLNNFIHAENLDDVPHAFLFLGPAGIGKIDLALEFAQKISESRQQHGRAEILEYDFAESGSVENMRELISYSNLTSVNGKKIFILKNFELAKPSSSNILLKTLEEPAVSSMFILVVNGQKVLPTIMSRCVAIRCFPLEESDMSGLASLAALPKNLSQIIGHYPSLGRQLQNDPERAQLLSDILGKLESRQFSLIDLNFLAELAAEDLQLLVSLWIYHLKRQIDSSNNLSTIVHNLKVAQNFYEDLQRTYNSKLVLQQFLMNTK